MNLRAVSWRLRLKLRQTPLRKLWLSWRHRGLDENDVFLACYPRSGSNWLQFLLFHAVTGKRATFQEINRHSPYLGDQKRAVPFLPGNRRFIKTHETHMAVYQQAIYLVRDPRDVVVSDFHFLQEREGFYGDFGQFFHDFLKGNTHGFGSWQENILSWLNPQKAGLSELLVLRYEDLHEHPARELKRALRFLEAEVIEERVFQAIEDNTVERMRQKEAQHRSLKHGRKADLHLVREGRVGAGLAGLTAEQIELMESTFRQAMELTGYL